MEKIAAKVTSEHPVTGLRRIALDETGSAEVIAWLESRGLDPREVIRGVRFRNNGSLSFQAGGGYAVFDADLLGGTGDGAAEQSFERETGYWFTLR